MTETTRTRAPKGTGSIVTRSGAYWAQWSSKDPATGKRRQHRAGPFEKPGDARKRLTAELGKVNAGTFIPAPKPKLVGEVLDGWLATKTDVRATTLDSYKLVIERWLRPRLGGTKVQALTEVQVRAALADLAATGSTKDGPLSPRSCALSLVTLKMALAWAVRQGWAVRNVAADVRVKQARTTMHAWTPVQSKAFLVAVSGDRLHALFALLLSRGLRRGEALGLTWDRVDLDGGSMAIVETLVLVNGRPTISTPKTAAGVRRIPLDVALVEVLKAHRRRQLEDRLRAGTAWHESGAVFADELGRPLRPDYVTHKFAKLCATAGVPVIRLHDLRHSAASAMLSMGVATKVVSEMLGHADTRITTEIYQHTVPSMGESAGAALSAALL